MVHKVTKSVKSQNPISILIESWDRSDQLTQADSRVSNFGDLLYCSYCGFLTIFTAVTSKDTVKPLVQYGMPKIPIEHEIFFVFAYMDCFKSNL